jgi:hypothetical protein
MILFSLFITFLMLYFVLIVEKNVEMCEDGIYQGIFMKFLAFLFVVAAALYGAEKVGEVVSLEGMVTAFDASQAERALSKRSALFLGDTIVTGAEAKGEVKFTDGTHLLLIPGSSFSVDSYGVEASRFFSRLTRGGARILTGAIAKRTPENFRLDTPNATIGVRGTQFESNLVNGNLYVGSSSGQVNVSNQAGSLSIGGKMPNGFASVPSPGSAPVPLEERPAALDLSLFSPPGSGAPLAAGAAAGQGAASSFAWGPALGAVVAIGAVVSTVAVTTTQGKSSSPSSTFAHAGTPPG